MDLMSDVSP